MIEPEFITRCVNILDGNPEVALCYSRAKIIDELGVYVVDYDPGPDASSPKSYVRFHNLVLHPEYAIQQMGVIRSEILRKTRLHASFPSSDEVLLAELALLGQFHEISDRSYVYRRHSEQSTRQPKQRDRVLFFDTSMAGKIVLPEWLYFLACLSAIDRSAQSLSVRLQCYATMVRWLFVPAHFRAMGKDFWVAANQLIGHSKGRKIQTSTSNA